MHCTDNYKRPRDKYAKNRPPRDKYAKIDHPGTNMQKIDHPGTNMQKRNHPETRWRWQAWWSRPGSRWRSRCRRRPRIYWSRYASMALWARFTCCCCYCCRYWSRVDACDQDSFCGYWSNRILHYFPLSVRPPCVTGVTFQLFLIIWWLRPWKPYIFWMHII